MSEELLTLSEKLGELIFWVRFSTWTTFIKTLKVTLRDDTDKLVYELSDGKRSTREIARFLSDSGRRITHTSVTNLWQKWASVPIVVSGSRTGRYRQVVSLRLAGIELPSIEGIPTQEIESNEQHH